MGQGKGNLFLEDLKILYNKMKALSLNVYESRDSQ